MNQPVTLETHIRLGHVLLVRVTLGSFSRDAVMEHIRCWEAECFRQLFVTYKNGVSREIATSWIVDLHPAHLSLSVPCLLAFILAWDICHPIQICCSIWLVGFRASFEMGSYYGTSFGLDRLAALPQPPKCWDYRHESWCLAEILL